MIVHFELEESTHSLTQTHTCTHTHRGTIGVENKDGCAWEGVWNVLFTLLETQVYILDCMCLVWKGKAYMSVCNLHNPSLHTAKPEVV